MSSTNTTTNYVYDKVVTSYAHPYLKGVSVACRHASTDNACNTCYFPLDDPRGNCIDCLDRKTIRSCIARLFDGLQCATPIFDQSLSGCTPFACCAGHDSTLSGDRLSIVVELYENQAQVDPCASVKLRLNANECSADNIKYQALRHSPLFADHWMLDEPIEHFATARSKQYPLKDRVVGLAPFQAAKATNASLRTFFNDMLEKNIYLADTRVSDYICNFPYDEALLGDFVSEGFSYANLLSVDDFLLLGSDRNSKGGPLVLPAKSLITSSLPSTFRANSNREFVLQMITTQEYSARLKSDHGIVKPARKAKLVIPAPVSVSAAFVPLIGATKLVLPPPLPTTQHQHYQQLRSSSPVDELLDEDVGVEMHAFTTSVEELDFSVEQSSLLHKHEEEEIDFLEKAWCEAVEEQEQQAQIEEEEEHEEEPKESGNKRERSKHSVQFELSNRALWLESIGFSDFASLNHKDFPRFFSSGDKFFVLYPVPGSEKNFKALCKEHAIARHLVWREMISGKDMNPELADVICPFDERALAKSYVVQKYESEQRMMEAYHVYVHLYTYSKAQMAVSAGIAMRFLWVVNETTRNGTELDFSQTAFEKYKFPTRASHWNTVAEERRTMFGETPHLLAALNQKAGKTAKNPRRDQKRAKVAVINCD